MRRIKAIMLIAALLLFVFAANTYAEKYTMVRQGSTGVAVQRVQMRLFELGYLNFKPTGSFRGMTVKATIAFQQMQVTTDGGYVAADGEAGEQTQSILFSARARRAPIASNVNIPIGPSLKGTPSVRGTLMTWEKVSELLTVNATYKLFDYNTGKSFRIRYMGGEKHGEAECATAEDTAIFLQVFGGSYNFSKRPAVLQISEDNLIAASVFGYPHGDDFVAGNDMEGHFCIFFDGSRSHVGNVTDVEHQKQIYTAAGM